MKLHIYLILLVLPAITLPYEFSLKKNNSINAETIEYKNENYKFKISYPKDWILREDLVPNTLFSLQDNMNANQMLAATAGETVGLIDSLYNSTIQLLELRMPGFHLISTKDTSINSVNCKIFTYKAYANGVSLKLRQYILVGGGYSYFFIFTSTEAAFDTWIEKYENVVCSFEQIK